VTGPPTRSGLAAAIAALRLESPRRTLLRLLGRPDLWPEVVVLAWRTAARRRAGGTRRRPYPSAGYLDFRAEAMLGDGARGLRPDEVVAYLGWCRRMRRLGG
jgi:hypothetical protein